MLQLVIATALVAPTTTSAGALGGYDPVACGAAASNRAPCTAVGNNATLSTQYVTVDKDGSP
eukprot:5774318-Prymnesium_polylepis.1